MTKINKLPKHARPRERLLELGANNLSNEQLIAVILGFGTSKANVLTLAKRILKKYKNISQLSNTSIKELTKISGIGQIQAGKLVSCFELGKRLNTNSQLIINNPSDVTREIKDIRDKTQEYLIALYLDARHRLVNKETLAIGSLNSLVLEARDIFSHAFKIPCSEIILAHNHPSGDINPSENDIKFTQKILEAGELLGIQLIDHIIVTKENYLSMREENLI
ncbi:MAG: DNA repair protein RadC [Patescibacteria group bacterium]